VTHELTFAYDHGQVYPALPTGRLPLEASGGGATREMPVPGSAYRARWPGRGFPAPGDYVPGDTQTDGYRIQLWPEEAVQAVVRAEAVARLRPPRRGGLGAAVVRRG
jgi:hypothetical protein